MTGRVDKDGWCVTNIWQLRIGFCEQDQRLAATIGGEKRSLAEIAHRLGSKALAEVAVAAKPDRNARGIGICERMAAGLRTLGSAPNVRRLRGFEVNCERSDLSACAILIYIYIYIYV
jgi:hypothetical protein